MSVDLKTMWRVSRACFLPVSLLPYTLGGLFALRGSQFHLLRFLLGGVGVASVHLAANMINDYWDFRMGADSHGGRYQLHFGGSQSIQEGLVTPEAVRTAAWCLFLFSLCLGVGFSLALKSLALLAIVAAGIFIAWAYTARPFSLAYRGWGEIALFTAFGPLLFVGGFYLQAQTAGGPVILLSLPSGLLIAAVLLANEMADTMSDREAGKRTLIVRLGERAGVLIIGGCLVAASVIPAAGIALAGFPRSFLLALAILPLAGWCIRVLHRAAAGHAKFETSSGAVRHVVTAYHVLMMVILIWL